MIAFLTGRGMQVESKTKARLPQTFTGNYPGAETHEIPPANIEEFITWQ